MDGDHLKQGLSSRKPLTHDAFQEGLLFQLPLFGGELDLDLLYEFQHLCLASGHAEFEHLKDGVKDVLGETTALGLVVGVGLLGPLLGGLAEELVSPQALHQLVVGDLEFISILLSKLLKGEGPAVQTRAETNSSLLGADLLEESRSYENFS